MDPTLRELTSGDEAALQALLESDAGCTERVIGYPPGSSDALRLLLVAKPYPASVAAEAMVWVRRLYVSPDRSALVAMDSRAGAGRATRSRRLPAGWSRPPTQSGTARPARGRAIAAGGRAVATAG
ncbi:MAG TPA: hypothetical protein VFG97_02740 [Pedococcus sp.]|nr:hypothetical protein [Pedococcus sp.]